MILVIDNYDSFTYNLVQQIESQGQACQVITNDRVNIEDIAKRKPSRIVISPGPGTPEDAGISKDIISRFHKTVPILGVCLGHQCIGVIFGAKIEHARKIMHGKTSKVTHDGAGIFKGVSSPLEVARYHSLAIDRVKSPLKVTARADDGTIMAIEHNDYPVFGVQFHPESFLTPKGELIMKNFLR